MQKIPYLFLMPLLFCWGIFSCQNNDQPKEVAETSRVEDAQDLKSDSIETVEVIDFNQEPKQFSYYAWPNQVDSFKKIFNETFSEADRLNIWALNRVDEKNSWRPDTLIIPTEKGLMRMDYAPFPSQLEMLQKVNKIVIFHYPLQVFAAYEKGILQSWGPTSMGSKNHPTPEGLHFANWKSKQSVSTVSDEWILPWNFNIANFEGVGWHEYSMPGYPASHSCLRLWSEDAQWLYQFAEQWILKDHQTKIAEGTPVIVHGVYPFGERRPWLNGIEHPEAIILSVQQMEEIIEPHLSKIMEKQEERVAYLQSQSQSNINL